MRKFIKRDGGVLIEDDGVEVAFVSEGEVDQKRNWLGAMGYVDAPARSVKRAPARKPVARKAKKR